MTSRTTISNEPAEQQFVAPDRTRVLSIVQSNGFFRFLEEEERCEPASASLDRYSYWAEAYRSGLYSTLQEALAAARIECSWLAEMTAN